MQNRRDFLKSACTACAGVAALGFIMADLESCKTADPNAITVSKKQVTVPLSQMADKNVLIIKSASLEYDIALVKKSEKEFVALKMVCPHRQNPVTTASTGFFCPSHGSEFDMDGKVTKGPSANSLTQFQTVIQKGKAIITI